MEKQSIGILRDSIKILKKIRATGYTVLPFKTTKFFVNLLFTSDDAFRTTITFLIR